MEWLSHSNKKHCELCKTPFRFTKLYDPKMPKSLPALVFLRHLLSRGVRFLLTSLRLSLIAVVWFAWLPWSMRACWRLLFWLGDGGWAMWGRSAVQITGQQALEISRERARRLGMDPLATQTDLTQPSSRPTGARSLPGALWSSSMVGMLSGAFQRGSGRSATQMVLDMSHRILGLEPVMTDPPLTLPYSPGIDPSHHLSEHALRDSSLLSNITFLNQLTDSPALNKVVIDILEGQMIALFVVVVSILIFLIREWVVQQQFGVNLEGEMNGELEARLNPADANAGPRAVAEDQPQEARDHVEPGGDPEPRPQGSETSEGPPETSVGASATQDDVEDDADVSNGSESLQLTNEDASSVSLANQDTERELPDTGDAAQFISHRHRRRPRLQPRNSSSTAVQIHRAIEEVTQSQPEHSPSSGKIMKLWLQGNRDMDEFLKNARREELTTDLQLTIDVLTQLQKIDPTGQIPATLQIADKIIAKADARSIASYGENNEEDPREPQETSEYALMDNQSRSSARDKGKRKMLHNSTQSPPLEATPPYDLVGTPDHASTSKSPLQIAHDDGVDVSETWSPVPAETPHRPIPESPGHHWSACDASAQRYMESNRLDTSSLQTTRSRSSSIDGRASSNSEASYPDTSGESSLEPSHNGHERPPVQEVQRNPAGTDLPRGPRPGILHNAIDWFWGDIDANQPPNDLLAINLGENAPQNLNNQHLEEIAHRMGDEPRNPNPFGPDVDDEDDGAEAVLLAAPDLEDAEAIEDGEDFDGILELAGVRGPLAGLFQNAMFTVVLLSAAVTAGIWIPYMWGKVVLVILANPIWIFVKLPLRWISLFAELTADLTLFFGGSILSWLDRLTRLFLAFLLPSTPFLTRYTQSSFLSDSALLMSERALDRIAKFILATSFRMSATDYPVFSVTSHRALQSLKTIPRDLSDSFCELLVSIYQGGTGPIRSLMWPWTLSHFDLQSFHLLTKWIDQGCEIASKSISALILSIGKLRASSLNIEIPKQTSMLDPGPASIRWTAMDRLITILAGYAMFSVLGAAYVRRGTPFSTSEQGRKLEGIIHSGLVQAGGILKVVIIISIEMIVFPLYCGVLLDFALLPLFHGATFLTRLEFTRNSPWTSAFVHWFVGTCYMFHFALFVSLCRKILRRGVLYFIRDPDDPTFHPVREVLEKSVTSQLRKIGLSALVYGALVIVCLGSVVWGLMYTFEGVLPIYWSSNEPVLEFPVDLLFYNFLMPLAVKSLRPSTGLQVLYAWWFQKCARLLRLTWFLFGEPREDEEGHYVRTTWTARLLRKCPKLEEIIIVQKGQDPPEDGQVDVYFVRDGRLVKTPGSDQVRVPRGQRVFVEVTEADDMAETSSQTRPENSEHERLQSYTKVHIPPWFRVRIGLFVFLIWIFAAITGVGMTIIPLVLGRMIFAALFSNHLRMNDVYAFAIGVYILGAIFYGAYHYEKGIVRAKRLLRVHCGSLTQALHQAYGFLVNTSKLLYSFTAFAFILPGLFAFLFELYIIIPLHTYFAADEKHVIHLVHDWTLGVLYVKIISRVILGYSHSRPARALRAITRHGWLKPDIGLATRFFILPAIVLLGTAILAPLPLAWLSLRLVRLDDMTDLSPTQIYRYSYPATLAAGFLMVLLYFFALVVRRWRQSIRDEVYLVGERLHNLGDPRGGSRPMAATAAAATA
ncbi:MAG: hypothetical protein M1816_002687 [Peltula sp. TS41687]|nr:MAG: hypothetical protein M1816_002687 [Peltula sp. TS41687]